MLIFLHGFNSSGNSDKANRLRREFPAMQVHTPDLNSQPDTAIASLIALIETALQQEQNVSLAGSSLGGFYAMYLAHRFALASILINPLIDPAELRQSIGPQQNYYSGERYTWTAQHCDQLDQMVVKADALAIKPLLLLDEQDELLDSRLAIAHFGPYAEAHLFPSGSHRFEHMDQALPLIAHYIEVNPGKLSR